MAFQGRPPKFPQTPKIEHNMPEEPFNLPDPPGFRGLDPNLPIRFYQRHLPHWRQVGATYFVTFRLADSIPQAHSKLSKGGETRGESIPLNLEMTNSGTSLPAK
jgi:hypothetical protein